MVLCRECAEHGYCKTGTCIVILLYTVTELLELNISVYIYLRYSACIIEEDKWQHSAVQNAAVLKVHLVFFSFIHKG